MNQPPKTQTCVESINNSIITVQKSVTEFTHFFDSLSASTYFLDYWHNFFILSFNNTLEVGQNLSEFNLNLNPLNALLFEKKNIITNKGNVFYNNNTLLEQLLFTTTKTSNLTNSAKRVFSLNIEVVKNSKLIEKNYLSIATAVTGFLVSTLFVFFLVFTLFIPVTQSLYGNDIFLFGLDSSYGLVESEKEVGTMDDVLLPAILTLLASAAWFYLIIPTQTINTFNASENSIFLLFFCCIIISLPVNFLYECGFFFSTFFRGASNTTSSVIELFYDLIANTVMFARMQVQHVRVLLGLAMYVETANYIETLSLSHLFDFSSSSTTINEPFVAQSVSSSLSFVIFLISQIATLIAEIGHYILFLLQSSASYVALIFWLFSLLYSGFFKDPVEIYFLNLKYTDKA